MWRLAAVMTASSLTGSERSQTLQRWAMHVWRQEGSVWRGVGLLAAAGALREALRLLLEAGLPDCAAAFISACIHARVESLLTSPVPLPPAAESAAAAASSSGAVEEGATSAPPQAQASASKSAFARPEDYVGLTSAIGGGVGGRDSYLYLSDGGGLTPFESLGSGMGLGVRSPVGGGGGGGRVAEVGWPGVTRRIGWADVARASTEFERFVSDLLTLLL